MLNVAIKSPELEKFVEDQVTRGQYRSADEVVAAGLALLRNDPDAALAAEELEGLQGEIGIGVDQADQKAFVAFTAEDVIAEGMKKRSERAGN